MLVLEAVEAVVVDHPSSAEVGEVAVVRFGGVGSTAPLHPLDRPFTDSDGPRILSQLQFDQVSWIPPCIDAPGISRELILPVVADSPFTELCLVGWL